MLYSDGIGLTFDQTITAFLNINLLSAFKWNAKLFHFLDFLSWHQTFQRFSISSKTQTHIKGDISMHSKENKFAIEMMMNYILQWTNCVSVVETQLRIISCCDKSIVPRRCQACQLNTNNALSQGFWQLMDRNISRNCPAISHFLVNYLFDK